MINLKSAIQTVFCLLLISISASVSAQSPATSSQDFYVEISTLNVESYVRLHNALKTDGELEITSACIPAHVIKVQSKASSETLASFTQKFGLIAQQAEILNVLVMESFTEEQFMDRCAQARSQGQ